MITNSFLWAGEYGELTSYFSMEYLLFFLPVVLVIYSILGVKQKRYFLLLASYAFFWMISGQLLVYLLISTVLIHYFGIWLDRLHVAEKADLQKTEKEEKKGIRAVYQNRKRKVLIFAVILHIGILLVLKYSGFFTENINALLNAFNVGIQFEIPVYAMPIGISFYTMQAVAYVMDVYRGTIKADDNIMRLALFMSFFPQIVEGPICRYEQTAEQLWNVSGIKRENLAFGAQRILYGMMKKMVIADRLNPLISEVFTKYDYYDGSIVAAAAVCYTIQLYMEFSGTMDAVIGTAQIFGITMPENFANPFFAKTIPGFWNRWHITLGAWFKDYIFYPVTLAKPVKKMTTNLKKKVGNYFALLCASFIALFCVWFCNGLWHGAAWNYIFFGMYHFALIIMGNIFEPVVKQVKKTLHINTEWPAYKVFQIVRTAILVVGGELFFRAHGLNAGLIMFKKIFTQFTWDFYNADVLALFGMDVQDIIIVLIALAIVFTVSVLKERGVAIRETLATKPLAVRWALLYGLILFIIIFGAYGIGYVPVDPIYANF